MTMIINNVNTTNTSNDMNDNRIHDNRCRAHPAPLNPKP